MHLTLRFNSPRVLEEVDAPGKRKWKDCTGRDDGHGKCPGRVPFITEIWTDLRAENSIDLITDDDYKCEARSKGI